MSTQGRTSDYYRTKNIPERFDNPGRFFYYLLYIRKKALLLKLNNMFEITRYIN